MQQNWRHWCVACQCISLLHRPSANMLVRHHVLQNLSAFMLMPEHCRHPLLPICIFLTLICLLFPAHSILQHQWFVFTVQLVRLQLNKLSYPPHWGQVLGADIAVACSHVRLVGVDISSALSLDHHVFHICSGCFYWLRQIWHIRRSLDIDSLHSLIYGLVNSCIDYCNTVLAGAPSIVIDKLQRVLNDAARVITGYSNVRWQPGSYTAWRTLLAQCTRPSIFQTHSDNLIGIWTTVHHRTWWTIASRSPMLTLGGICILPTAIYSQYHISGSILLAIGPLQLPALWSVTLSRILSGTRWSVQTVSDVY